MAKDPKDMKSVKLQQTYVMRDAAESIKLTGDFDPIDVRRESNPRGFAILDDFLQSKGK